MPDTERLMAKTADEGRINPENPQVIGVTRKGDNNQPTIPDVLPILPVRSLVIFPIPALPDGTPWRLPGPNENIPPAHQAGSDVGV